ncbi:deubiquitinating enzyme [Kickxella alabastrina]|nr:deubiquitinating enzyme [Kickxella alabastrina]
MVKGTVKWQGKKYEVDADITQPGETFKMQVYSLTSVAPDRQKILVKGGQLKDDTDMSKLGLKENQMLMMIGTVSELPKMPMTQAKFVEDMTENEVARALAIPAGLENLGNTCYANASLQCLKAVPHLKEALDEFRAGGAAGTSDPRRNLATSLRGLFDQLSESSEGVPPMVFLSVLRQIFPKFGEMDPQSGGYRQQDAEEFWSELLTALDRVLKKDENEPSVVEKYMSGTMVTTWKTDEAPEEPEVVQQEPFRKLDCRIDRTVNYLSQGIHKGLEQVVEKNSASLGRNAEYKVVSRIARLPEYLTVAYSRFFWKASESVDAKIVKSVRFPLELDVSEFCTPELQKKMQPAKQYLREIEDKIALERKMSKRAKLNEERGSEKGKKPEEMDVDVEAKKEEEAVEAAAKPVAESHFELDPELKADVGCNPSGIYELVGVVTHIGRSANSGHYMAWVRKEKGVGGPDPAAAPATAGGKAPGTQHWWYKFDDDNVSMVTDDEILKLCGGGDWHTAYVTLYRAKKLD